MEYTGYKIIQYIDDNPNSPTYGHTWEEKVYDFENCSLGDDNWIVITDGCELDVTGYTGNRITVYYNSKTDSYSSVTVYDESCVASSSEEIWEATGEERCEKVNGAYTGYKIQIQKQTNRNLANYGQKREYKYISPDCKRNISCAVWDEISRSCHIAVNNCNLTFDGTADVVQIDSNPLSETYNKTRTINVEDTGTCTNCTETTFAYTEIGDFCGYDVCYSGLTDDNTPTNLYTVSRKNKTINGNTIPMDEYVVTLKETESEECGYIRPHYRWVATSERVCVGYNLHVIEKEQVSYDLEETWADYYVDGQLVTRTSPNPIAVNVYSCGYPMYKWVNTDETECGEELVPPIKNAKFISVYDDKSYYYELCDDDPVLSTATTKPSGYESTAMTIAVIGGDCITTIGTLTYNGNYPFDGCYNLSRVNSEIEGECNIPDGVETIGNYAFDRCNKLHKLSLPNSLKNIGNAAFSSFDDENGFLRVNSETDGECNIPVGVEFISDGAFYYNNKLTNINIPSSVNNIGNNPFDSCGGIEAITVNPNNTYYDSRNSCNAIIKTSTNELISGCKNTIIPNDVTSINFAAFRGATGLTNISIPSSVASIERCAFQSCENLTSISIPYGITEIKDDTFSECYSLSSVTIPNSVTKIGRSSFTHCRALTSIGGTGSGASIEIPNSVTTIENAFYYCSNITDVNIPSTVTNIEGNFLEGCSSLSSITVDANNAYYDSRNNCNAVIRTSTNELIQGCQSTVIPNTVTKIGWGAFMLHSQLSYINIPNSVTSIDEQAFTWCYALTGVTVGNGITSIGNRAFSGINNLRSFTINTATPPALGEEIFNDSPNVIIYVPSGSVDVYKSASGWNRYTDKIRAI